MSLTYRIARRAQAVAGKQLAFTNTSRTYANYPFTFPVDSTVTPQATEAAVNAPKSPYPFTTPGQPADKPSPVAPEPSRGRAGDNDPEYMKESDLRMNQERQYENMEMQSGKQPDYNVMADYRTSYVTLKDLKDAGMLTLSEPLLPFL